MRRVLRRVGLFVALLAFAVGGFLHVYQLDGLSGTVLGWILREDTEYAPQYSDATFRAVALNTQADVVRRQLGPPLYEMWSYPSDLHVMIDGNRRVRSAIGALPDPVQVGAADSQVVQILGDPESVNYHYSRSPTDTHYRYRRMTLQKGRVVRKDHYFYID